MGKDKLSEHFFCEYNVFSNPMAADVGEFFSISNDNILAGFKP